MYKTVLVALLLLAGVIGLAFATGVVSLSRGDDEAEHASATGETDDEDDEALDEAVDGLKSLGYVGATPIPAAELGKVGVVVHEKDKTAPGFNLAVPCGWGREFRDLGLDKPLREARLFDMDGEVRHRWAHDFPGRGSRGWATAELGPDGSLYVVVARTGLAKLDWDSNLVWGRTEELYHHDLDVLPDGSVVGLVESQRTIEFDGAKVRINDNGMSFVSADGEHVRTLWFYDLVGQEKWFVDRLKSKVLRAKRINPNAKAIDVPEDEPLGHITRLGGFDVFHANTIEVLAAESKGLWKKGDLLTSFRSLDTIAVFDRETGELRWSWGRGTLDDQHDPTLTGDGNILVFDNGRRRRQSRVLEVDPSTNRIVWKYDGTDGAEFYSDIRGLVQPLANGDILVNVSQSGRVLEVQRDGTLVWEYFTTDVVENHRIPLRLLRIEGELYEALSAKLAG